SATSSPPPSAVPWIAATTGFEQFSIVSTTCGSHGFCGGLPNSVMSAPAKKVCPSQAMTTAFTLSSPSASAIASTRPWRTGVESAFTGGLFDSTISTSPCLRVEIGLVMALSITSSMSHLRPGRYGAADTVASGGTEPLVHGASGRGDEHGRTRGTQDARAQASDEGNQAQREGGRAECGPAHRKRRPADDPRRRPDVACRRTDLCGVGADGAGGPRERSRRAGADEGRASAAGRKAHRLGARHFRRILPGRGGVARDPRDSGAADAGHPHHPQGASGADERIPAAGRDRCAGGDLGRVRRLVPAQPDSHRERMKARVFITLKPGVLDPQGKAIHHALEGLGFSGVNDVRAGKLIELDLAEGTKDSEIEDMCRKLLANTVIENFRIERLQDA